MKEPARRRFCFWEESVQRKPAPFLGNNLLRATRKPVSPHVITCLRKYGNTCLHKYGNTCLLVSFLFVFLWLPAWLPIHTRSDPYMHTYTDFQRVLSSQ